MTTPRPRLAGFLSFLVPGLGQLYAGRGRRGALLLLAAPLFWRGWLSWRWRSSPPRRRWRRCWRFWPYEFS